jgi:hypothetical protein
MEAFSFHHSHDWASHEEDGCDTGKILFGWSIKPLPLAGSVTSDASPQPPHFSLEALPTGRGGRAGTPCRHGHRKLRICCRGLIPPASNFLYVCAFDPDGWA